MTGTAWNAQYGAIDGTDATAQQESAVLFQEGETGSWKSWVLTNVTQEWVTGDSSNYGVILWATNEDTDGYDLRFYSSEAASNKPKLEVTYSTAQKTVYFLKDHLGSIRATVLDSSTVPVVGYDDYDPWGYILANRSSATAWSGGQNVAKNKFTGKEWDDDYSLNWNYFGARYYDPEIGRWMVRDALAENYARWSPYNYTLDNPVNFIDPDGNEVGSKGGGLVRARLLMQLAKQMITFASRDRIDYRSFLNDIQGKSLHTLQTEADPERRFISAGGPLGDYKYVIDPAFPNRTIDMRHFLVVGQHGMMFSNDPESKLILANITGLLNEGYQLTKGLLWGDTSFQSAFQLEDLYSNYLGSLFFSYFYDPNSTESISSQLQRFFQWWIKFNKESKNKKEDENEEENEDNQN